jgi:hypothetical protein
VRPAPYELRERLTARLAAESRIFEIAHTARPSLCRLLPPCDPGPDTGSLLAVAPNHVCRPVVNLARELIVVDGDDVVVPLAGGGAVGGVNSRLYGGSAGQPTCRDGGVHGQSLVTKPLRLNVAVMRLTSAAAIASVQPAPVVISARSSVEAAATSTKN